MSSQSSANCEICQKKFNQFSRKQMILCLNQHKCCLVCADNISQIDPRCPVCRGDFKMNQIRPWRFNQPYIPQKNLLIPLCPQQGQSHLSGSFTLSTTTEWLNCHKCSRRFCSIFTCKQCKYHLCYRCVENKHQQFCKQPKMKYREPLGRCPECMKKFIAIKQCQNCGFHVCGECSTKIKNEEA